MNSSGVLILSTAAVSTYQRSRRSKTSFHWPRDPSPEDVGALLRMWDRESEECCSLILRLRDLSTVKLSTEVNESDNNAVSSQVIRPKRSESLENEALLSMLNTSNLK